MDCDTSLQSDVGLGDLIVEDTGAVCGTKEERLHPVESLVCLEDQMAVLVEGYLMEAVAHFELAEDLGSKGCIKPGHG